MHDYDSFFWIVQDRQRLAELQLRLQHRYSALYRENSGELGLTSPLLGHTSLALGRLSDHRVMRERFV